MRANSILFQRSQQLRIKRKFEKAQISIDALLVPEEKARIGRAGPSLTPGLCT